MYLTEKSIADFRKRETLPAGANTGEVAGVSSKGVAMPPDCQDRKNNCPHLARQRQVFQCVWARSSAQRRGRLGRLVWTEFACTRA